MPSLSLFRQRFGLFMVGLVLIVCLVLLVRQKFFVGGGERPLTPVEPVVTIPLTPIDPVELQAEWRTAINSVLADYDRTGDARSAKERLLTIRVPASGRDTHLALYLAFNALSESRPEGRVKLTEARTVFQAQTATIPASPVTTSSTTSTAR